MRLPFILLFLSALATCSESLAVSKKKSAAANRAASTRKGFGAAPPTLAEVVRQFPTRLPADASSLPCPCGATESEDNDDTDGATVPGARRLYRDCCEPLHSGARACTRPLDVLRSRYAAFAYRLVPHVMATTHPSCSDYRADRVAWARSLDRDGMFDHSAFAGLAHGPEEFPDDDTATIEFTVTLRPQSGGERLVREKSTFLRGRDGVWSYASGKIHVSSGEDPQLLSQ